MIFAADSGSSTNIHADGPKSDFILSKADAASTTTLLLAGGAPLALGLEALGVFGFAGVGFGGRPGFPDLGGAGCGVGAGLVAALLAAAAAAFALAFADAFAFPDGTGFGSTSTVLVTFVVVTVFP